MGLSLPRCEERALISAQDRELVKHILTNPSQNVFQFSDGDRKRHTDTEQQTENP